MWVLRRMWAALVPLSMMSSLVNTPGGRREGDKGWTSCQSQYCNSAAVTGGKERCPCPSFLHYQHAHCPLLTIHPDLLCIHHAQPGGMNPSPLHLLLHVPCPAPAPPPPC